MVTPLRQKHLPIWAKIGVSFGGLCLVLLAVGGIALNRIDAINEQIVLAHEDWLPSQRTLGQLRSRLDQYRLAEVAFAGASGDREIAAAADGVRRASAAVDDARDECARFITPGTDDVRYMRAFDHAWGDYRKAGAAMIRASGSGRRGARERLAAAQPLYRAAYGALSESMRSNTDAGLATATAAAQYVKDTRLVLLTALLAVLVMSAVLGVVLTRSVSMPLASMTRVMGRLARHDLAVEIPERVRNDELGVMANAIEVFRRSLIETDELRERQDAQHELLIQSERRFRSVFDSVNEGILIIDPGTGRFAEVNRRGCEMLDREPKDIVGAAVGSFSAEETPGEGSQVMERLERAGNDGPQLFDWYCMRGDGRPFWAEVSLRRATIADRDVVVATLRDISERRRVEARIRQMALHDALTGLPNRSVFVDAAGREIGRANREGRLLAVLFLDLDHFKDINDTLGHPAGDELLRVVAERLSSAVRKSDVVARFGGDEFAVLATQLHEANEAAALASKLLQALEAPFMLGSNRIVSGASIGIALYPHDGTDAASLMSHADVALYCAKAEGRGDYRFFTDSMDLETRERVNLLAELREAIDSQQFFLAYQPQVLIDGGQVTGLEALLRWRHPRRGILSPDAFIGEAERGGVIAPLGEWVLGEACRQAGAWLRAGILPPSVGVNLSMAQLRAPAAFEQLVAVRLSENGVPAQRLELEVADNQLLSAENPPEALARLRSLGVRLALGDFGAGCSSLWQLGRFKADRLKIARALVRSLESREAAAVVRAAIGLGRELGMRVIAEGVETERQTRLLASWGCEEAQGYHFARPLAAADVEPLLRAGRIAAA